jgi:hypothetical protein
MGVRYVEREIHFIKCGVLKFIAIFLNKYKNLISSPAFKVSIKKGQGISIQS